MILLLQYAAFENCHSYESINLNIDNSINVSNLHIIRQEKDCTFTWYALHLLKFCQAFRILKYCWVACFLKHPVLYLFAANAAASRHKPYPLHNRLNCNSYLRQNLCRKILSLRNSILLVSINVVHHKPMIVWIDYMESTYKCLSML